MKRKAALVLVLSAIVGLAIPTAIMLRKKEFRKK